MFCFELSISNHNQSMFSLRFHGISLSLEGDNQNAPLFDPGPALYDKFWNLLWPTSHICPYPFPITLPPCHFFVYFLHVTVWFLVLRHTSIWSQTQQKLSNSPIMPTVEIVHKINMIFLYKYLFCFVVNCGSSVFHNTIQQQIW